jgi:hypothetical protein
MNKEIICLNDKNRPNEISENHWIKEGEYYSPIKIVKAKIGGAYYFVLKEVHPDNPLYGGYNINRFGAEIQDVELAIKNKEIEYEVV